MYWCYQAFNINVLDVTEINDNIFRKQLNDEYECIVIEWDQSSLEIVKSVVNKVVVSSTYVEWKKENKNNTDPPC